MDLCTTICTILRISGCPAFFLLFLPTESCPLVLGYCDPLKCGLALIRESARVVLVAAHVEKAPYLG